MVVKKGIPQEVLDELDIRKKRDIKPIEITVAVEDHQAKIPIPKNIRLKLKLERGAKCIISYDEKNKELNCKFK